MKRRLLTVVLAVAVTVAGAKKIKFDFSTVFVPEEGGVKFEKITDDADRVADYDGNIVSRASSIFGSRKATAMDWWVVPQIALSPDGKRRVPPRVEPAFSARSAPTCKASRGVLTVRRSASRRYVTAIKASTLLTPNRVLW